MKGKTQPKPKAISYRVKDYINCKVCDTEFQREQLHSGGGRLIAGKLTPELRRLYEINKKYGKVYPLAYTIMTCPNCLYSSNQSDFGFLGPDDIQNIQKSTLERRTGIEKIVGPVDFHEDRNLVLGAASYILAINCYQERGHSCAPTPKKAICSLRGAWLFSDMHEEFPEYGFNKISDFLYLKAVTYYNPTLDIMSNGSEPHDQFTGLLGPDTDNNWSFDGVIYLNGFFTLKFLDKLSTDPKEQVKILDRGKRFLGKLYGMGRSSKSKPSVLIDMSKDLYEEISTKIEELQGV